MQQTGEQTNEHTMQQTGERTNGHTCNLSGKLSLQDHPGTHDTSLLAETTNRGQQPSL